MFEVDASPFITASLRSPAMIEHPMADVERKGTQDSLDFQGCLQLLQIESRDVAPMRRREKGSSIAKSSQCISITVDTV